METTAGPEPGPAAPGADPKPGDTVGRYRVERILGAGGMGVVFAAHDPDLDRLVALKILRTAAGRDHTQARARLLREARAMAKLSHPNVITVHEVGTDGSRDFVAMELIDGKNVADWLTERRPAAEVLRVMLAAGRGLAAAHAAGLVHRDFKPHNVLLGRDGRVVVTDFGLARAFEGETGAGPATGGAPPSPQIGFEETVDAPKTPPAPDRPRADASSLSSTLTQTGTMLGTPAYMAPEQFAGAATGPETDQFAFCVAVWEGLAGTRPFRGGSIDELRRAVEGGTALGGGSIARRYRGVLARGLRRDPAARWPNMDALLSALGRAEKRPRRVGAAIAFAVALGASGGVFMMTRPAAVERPSACVPGELMTWSVWSPALAAELEAHFASEPEAWARNRAGLDAITASWRDTWKQACAEPESPRFHGRVSCLTGALDELGALTETMRDAPGELLRQIEVAQLLPPPAGCLDSTRIGLPAPPEDPAVRAEVARLRRDFALARAWARAQRGDDAKARAAAALEAARKLDRSYPAILAEALEVAGTVHDILGEHAAAETLYEEAAIVAERAGHDPVRATVLLGLLAMVAERSSDADLIRSHAERALAAIERAGNEPSLRAGVDLTLAKLAMIEGDLDRAIELAERARITSADSYERRRAGVAARHEASLRLLRDAEGDAAIAEELLEKALAVAEDVFGPEHPYTMDAIAALAGVRWETGDLAAAHALFDRLQTEPDKAAADLPLLVGGGRVVDDAGAPVAGATVYAGRVLVGDPLGLVFRRAMHDGWGYRAVVTDAEGRFSVEAPSGAMVVAEHGSARASPVLLGKDTRLALREPGTVSGRIQMRGGPPAGDDAILSRARAARIAQCGVASGTSHSRFIMVGPLDDDNRWAIPGVPAGSYDGVAIAMTLLGDIHQRFTPLTVAPGGSVSIEQTIELDGVVLDVIVRSDRAGTIPSAEVHVLPGKRALKRTEDLYGGLVAAGRSTTAYAAPIDDRGTSEPGRTLYRDDDIHALMSGVVPGAATICVIPFGGDIADEGFMSQLSPHVEQLEMACTVVTIAAEPAIQAVVVETPPMKRLDSID